MVRRAGIMDSPASTITPVDVGGPEATNTDNVWQTLGAQAKQLREKMQPALDSLAEAQANQDFEAGHVHQRTVWSHEDAIYNNAMQQRYLLNVDSDIQARATQVEQDHAMDTNGFDQAWDGVRSSFIENAPPEFAGHVSALLDQEHAQTRQRIGQRIATHAMEQVSQDAAANMAQQEANLSGFDDLNSPEFTAAWKRYESTGSSLSQNPLTGMTPDEWSFRRNHTLSRLQGNALQTHAFNVYQDGGGNAESAHAAIAELDRAARDATLTLTDSERDSIFGEGRRQIMRAEQERLQALREARAEMRAYSMMAREDARDTIAAFQARANAFIPIPDTEIDGLRQTVEQSSSPALVRQFNQLMVENRTRQQMHNLSLTQMEQTADALEQQVAGGGEHADDAAFALQAARAYIQHVRTGNPLDVAQAHFDVPMPQILGDQAGPQALQHRIEYAEGAASRIGAAQPTYFTPGEREQLAGVARQGGESALALAREIVGTAYAGDGDGFTRAQRMLAEVGGTGGQSLQAAGTVLLLGGNNAAPAARYILEAQRLHSTPGYTPPNMPGVNDAQWRQTTFRAALGANQADLSPQASANLRLAADGIFEGMVAEDPARGRNPQQTYRQAVQMALGQSVRHNGTYGGMVDDGGGRRIVSPNWIRSDQFGVIRRSLSMQDFDLAGRGAGQINHRGGYPPTTGTLDDWRNARLVWTGEPGRYYMEDDRGHYESAPGVPYVLDFNVLRPRLAERRPDAVAH